MLENWDDEIAARFTALEFMLEVLFARHLAEQSPEVEQVILSELARLKSNPHGAAIKEDPQRSQIILDRSAEIQDHFLEKASMRADQIRSVLGG